ncbi:hypothetical protein BJF93_00845 [Xaviernesmea oryzae]|uniref:Uncharacterized protein n=1 Tax=Xaviernesmea oryzae TaxID=464029 RepID=A0A1Q9B0M0_9HYPH|nr:CopG family antitoxin [Xaviernesmea oryzae]OLP61511.1 hypothetical protein BJF93_00845 [Xaviernesmea oryzae]SEL66917.1 Predicted DNA binding protein, CopG/RHH family [Xaviernesmea oryzae]
MKKADLKTLPDLASDEEADVFVETADLSDYDLSGFKPVRFEFERKSAQLNMRLPGALLSEVKRKAAERNIPYTRLIREILEEGLRREKA